MHKTDSMAFLEIVAAALEKLAYMAIEPLEPAEAAATPPTDAVPVRVRLRLPEPAVVEMIAPRRFGALIVSNVTGAAPDATPPNAEQHLQRDAERVIVSRGAARV